MAPYICTNAAMTPIVCCGASCGYRLGIDGGQWQQIIINTVMTVMTVMTVDGPVTLRRDRLGVTCQICACFQCSRMAWHNPPSVTHPNAHDAGSVRAYGSRSHINLTQIARSSASLIGLIIFVRYNHCCAIVQPPLSSSVSSPPSLPNEAQNSSESY